MHVHAYEYKRVFLYIVVSLAAIAIRVQCAPVSNSVGSSLQVPVHVPVYLFTYSLLLS